MKRLQAGDIDYKQLSAAAAVRNKIELDGIKAEKNSTVLKVSHKTNYIIIPRKRECMEKKLNKTNLRSL